jgi:hypothetical protein
MGRIANRTAVRVSVATVAAGVLAAGAFTLMSSAGASPAKTAAGTMSTTMGMHTTAGHVGYGFRTLDDTADPTFNQLLGINDNGLIAGYFGSGAQGHPNMGYQLNGASYTSENFPGSVQTQVTGLPPAALRRHLNPARGAEGRVPAFPPAPRSFAQSTRIC